MACGGCRNKAQALVEKLTPKQPEPRALIRCPGCNAMHTDEEYATCPWRIQKEKNQKREQAIKAMQPEQTNAYYDSLIDRRGIAAKPIPILPQRPDTKKKW